MEILLFKFIFWMETCPGNHWNSRDQDTKAHQNMKKEWNDNRNWFSINSSRSITIWSQLIQKEIILDCSIWHLLSGPVLSILYIPLNLLTQNNNEFTVDALVQLSYLRLRSLVKCTGSDQNAHISNQSSHRLNAIEHNLYPSNHCL